jgi:hypothetical protein
MNEIIPFRVADAFCRKLAGEIIPFRVADKVL